MTFSDIVTVLGAGAGMLILLVLAAAPLLADLDPNPHRRAAGGRAGHPERSAAPDVGGVPAPRSPALGESLAPASGSPRPAIAG